jgi:gas vesicle protein
MDERRASSGFGAFLLGGLFGAAFALLLAPRTGKETREMLSEKANDYWGRAGDMYATGVDKVNGAVDTGTNAAGEKGEQLRGRIDDARSRLQSQVAKSAEAAKGKVVDATPTVKDVVDKAAEGTKSGVDFAAGKAAEGLDYVAKRAAGDGSESAEEAEEAPKAPSAKPAASKAANKE